MICPALAAFARAFARAKGVRAEHLFQPMRACLCQNKSEELGAQRPQAAAFADMVTARRRSFSANSASM